MTRIVSYNVNGIRAAITKGLFEWIETDPADIICFQETKALETDVDISKLVDLGFNAYWYSAQKKGYSGVAVLTKVKPNNVVYGMGWEPSDFEGRVIRLDFEDFTLINAYFPSGTSDDERQAFKYVWLDAFFNYIDELKKEKPNLVITGDYNICHKPIDIHNPVSNKNSSGFLPEERAWMDKWFGANMVDSFRKFHDEGGKYSWWSYRANARANNKGWRIDYISVTEPLADRLINADIFPDIKQSDHCPILAVLK